MLAAPLQLLVGFVRGQPDSAIIEDPLLFMIFASGAEEGEKEEGGIREEEEKNKGGRREE